MNFQVLKFKEIFWFPSPEPEPHPADAVPTSCRPKLYLLRRVLFLLLLIMASSPREPSTCHRHAELSPSGGSNGHSGT